VTTRNIPDPITGSTSEIAEKSVRALNEQRRELDRHDEADSRLCFISSTYFTTLPGLGNRRRIHERETP
jgi:hypothetical protein